MLLLATLALGGCDLLASPFQRECEKLLLERLVAPSTYKLQTMTFSVFPVDRMDWVVGKVGRYTERMAEYTQDADHFLSRGHKLVEHAGRMEYDAQNSFGALVRSSVWCSFFGIEGDDAPGAGDDLRIDGMSASEWFAHSLGNGQ
jgi:hypothetical protein